MGNRLIWYNKENLFQWMYMRHWNVWTSFLAVHVINLYTSHHKVTIYREKFKYIPKREHCVIHCDRIYNKYCKPCGVPVCDSCSVHKPRGTAFLSYFYPRKQKEHKLVCLKTAYIAKIQKFENKYEQTAYRPVKFLRFIKTSSIPRIQDTPSFTAFTDLPFSGNQHGSLD